MSVLFTVLVRFAPTTVHELHVAVLLRVGADWTAPVSAITVIRSVLLSASAPRAQVTVSVAAVGATRYQICTSRLPLSIPTSGVSGSGDATSHVQLATLSGVLKESRTRSRRLSPVTSTPETVSPVRSAPPVLPVATSLTLGWQWENSGAINSDRASIAQIKRPDIGNNLSPSPANHLVGST